MIKKIISGKKAGLLLVGVVACITSWGSLAALPFLPLAGLGIPAALKGAFMLKKFATIEVAARDAVATIDLAMAIFAIFLIFCFFIILCNFLFGYQDRSRKRKYEHAAALLSRIHTDVHLFAHIEQLDEKSKLALRFSLKESLFMFETFLQERFVIKLMGKHHQKSMKEAIALIKKEKIALEELRYLLSGWADFFKQ